MTEIVFNIIVLVVGWGMQEPPADSPWSQSDSLGGGEEVAGRSVELCDSFDWFWFCGWSLLGSLSPSVLEHHRHK